MVVDTSTTGLLYLVVSVVLPVLVALVTKQTALGSTKAYVLLFLASVNSFAFAWYDASKANNDFDIKNAALGIVVSFVIAAVTHAGLLKPAGVTGSQGAVQTKTADIGIGN